MEQTEGLSCSYAQSAYSAIRSFFRKNNVSLNMDGNDRPDGEGYGSAVPTKEQIKKLIRGAGTLRYRALILFLKDSGLRISDVLRLKWADLKPYDREYYGFEIVTQKRKAKAQGFVGPETVEALKLYREKRIQGTRKIPAEQHLEEHYVFCARANPQKGLTVPAASQKIGSIFRRIGYGNLTGHGLRKFWEQSMKADREAYLKQLNGRKLTGTEHAYLRKNPGELFDIYTANYDNLRVLEQPMIKQDEIEVLVEKRVQERVAYLNTQLTALRNELGRMRRILDNPLMVQWLEEKLKELQEEQK